MHKYKGKTVPSTPFPFSHAISAEATGPAGTQQQTDNNIKAHSSFTPDPGI